MPSNSHRAELLRRVKTPSADALRLCTIPGCGRVPEARQGNGLSPYLCRYHRQFRARHGSPMKRSYTAAELKPYVRAAERFVKAHKDDRYIQWSLDHLSQALANAGPVQPAGDLPWMGLRDKTRASLAMLREKGIPPFRLLAVALGVCAAIEEDTYGPGGDRSLFTRVQIAKALRRRASGTHRVYESGLRIDRYPRSSGKVLEALGALMEKACEWPLHQHLAAVLTLKQERYGVLPIAPQATIAKSRFGNTKVPPPPEPAREAPKLSRREEAREAERIARELRAGFATDGYAVFGPRNR
jgi:hypothetical protein